MTTINLACREGHTFEAWFRSKAEFSRQHAAKLVACPWCGERDIERRPSMPNVMRSRDKRGGDRGEGYRSDRNDAANETTNETANESVWSPSPSMQSFASALRAFHRYIEHTCEHVGDRFASEARKMHEEHEERGQYEQYSKEQKEERAERFSHAKGGGKKRSKDRARGIYGQATPEELCALEEEGIAVSPLPPLPTRHN